MGVPWRDAPRIGNLLGTRMAINEFVAYSQLERSRRRSIRSLSRSPPTRCAAANFSSIGVQISGIGALAPAATIWRAWV